MKDDESSIRSGPTCYTGDPLASDLGNRSAAGTDWEWATTKIWARLRDLVTVITTSKLSVRTDFDLARQSRHSLAPTTSKAPTAVPLLFRQGLIRGYQSGSTSHAHEPYSHASYICPCMHGIRPIG